MALAPLTWLTGGGMRIGLGCMRLPTGSDGAEARAVVAAALASGVAVLDTARAYDGNERLVSDALRAARTAPGAGVRIVTKGGMARPLIPSGVPGSAEASGPSRGRAWVPDGRARTIRADCEASLRALGGWPIALWLLHAPDPRTPWATSLRAMGRLVDEGLVAAVGVSNVTRAQLDQALDTVPVAAVQMAVSVLDDGAARGGVLARCEERGIAVLAHSPLGGPARIARLRRDPVLAEVAAAHGATPAQVALAWLLARSPVLVPIPGARRPEAVREAAAAARLALTPAEVEAITRRFAWPLTEGGGPRGEQGEVVLLMGIPGAGKTRASAELVAAGHHRLNRDERGGTLRQLAGDLDTALAAGHRRVVADNTYLTRAARNRVVEVARSHGLGVRCRWIDTPLAQAQVNVVHRLLDHFGALPSPEELAAAARREPNLLSPTAQMRAARQLEEPSVDEGFTAVERIPFERSPGPVAGRPALLVAAGALASPQWPPTVTDALARLATGVDGPVPVLIFDWRPIGGPADPPADGPGRPPDVPAGDLLALRDLAGGPVDVAVCPHPGGPPTCWCRPPLPGLPLAFARVRGVDLTRSLLVAAGPAHRTLAATVGAAVAT